MRTQAYHPTLQSLSSVWGWTVTNLLTLCSFFFAFSLPSFLFYYCCATFQGVPPETFSNAHFSIFLSTLLLPTALLYTAQTLIITASPLFSPPPPPPTLSSFSPFTLTAFVALIANECQNLSALRTCTSYLCVGHRFKDESLSAQRLYTHAFAFDNTEPDRHSRQDRETLYIFFPALSFF